MKSVRMSCKDVILGMFDGREISPPISPPNPYDVILSFYPNRNVTLCTNSIRIGDRGEVKVYECVNKDCPFNIYSEEEVAG